MKQENLIVITGASSGIGKELTLQLAERKNKVLAVARDENKLRAVAAENPNYIKTVVADIAIEEGRNKIFSSLPEDVKISALVNNAAVMTPSGNLQDIELAKWRYQLAVNLEGPLFLANQLLPYLYGGRILNLTVYSSYKITPGLAAYGISKAALNMLTQYWQVELEKYEIAVTNALPGLVDTDMQKQLPQNQAEVVQRINQYRQQGKLLNPFMAAAFIAWLLLDLDKETFSSKTWDIYDDSHHHEWAKQFVIPKLN